HYCRTRERASIIDRNNECTFTCPAIMCIAMVTTSKYLVLDLYRDAHSCRTRELAFLVAGHCSQAAAARFWPSISAGPAVTSGFDIALTEVIAADAHYFVMQAGSQLGQAVLDQVTQCLADSTEIQAAAQCVANARAQMERRLDTVDIQNLLYRNAENPRW